MTSRSSVFARYPGSAGDEAVGPDGAVRPPYEPVARALDGLGAVGITAVVGAVAQERRIRGVAFGTFVDGRLHERPFPLCPVPRVLSAADWSHLSRGVEQRTRALNAFLADVYRQGGRRRTDAEQQSEVVRAGVVPEWLVSASPGFRPAAVGLAAAGQQRITVAGLDLLHGPAGWVVLEDNLRVPSGIGYALTNRDSGRTALPRLYREAEAAGLVDPAESVALLRAALADAAPAGCAGVPQLGLLTDGEHNSAYWEHAWLSRQLGIPLVEPDELEVRDGVLWLRARGLREERRIDVL